MQVAPHRESPKAVREAGELVVVQEQVALHIESPKAVRELIVACLAVTTTREGKGARRAQKGAASPPVDGLEEEKGEAHGGEAAEAAKGGSDCHGGLVLGVPREKISPRRGSAGLGGAQRGDGGAPPRGGALLHRGHPGSLQAVDAQRGDGLPYEPFTETDSIQHPGTPHRVV